MDEITASTYNKCFDGHFRSHLLYFTALFVIQQTCKIHMKAQRTFIEDFFSTLYVLNLKVIVLKYACIFVEIKAYWMLLCYMMISRPSGSSNIAQLVDRFYAVLELLES